MNKVSLTNSRGEGGRLGRLRCLRMEVLEKRRIMGQRYTLWVAEGTNHPSVSSFSV